MPGEDEGQSKGAASRRDRTEAAGASGIDEARSDADDGHNPLALGLGLLVVLALLLGTWFVVNAISCDPLFSDAGLSHSRACR